MIKNFCERLNRSTESCCIGLDERYCKGRCRIKDEIVSKEKSIKIYFDYPLLKPVCFTFENETGFPLTEFIKCVREGYERIYKEESNEKVPTIKGMMNRQTTNGPYGIYGHYINDLRFLGYELKMNGIYHLNIVSR